MSLIRKGSKKGQVNVNTFVACPIRVQWSLSQVIVKAILCEAVCQILYTGDDTSPVKSHIIVHKNRINTPTNE